MARGGGVGLVEMVPNKTTRDMGRRGEGENEVCVQSAEVRT